MWLRVNCKFLKLDNTTSLSVCFSANNLFNIEYYPLQNVTAWIRSLQESYVFTHVCLSVHIRVPIWLLLMNHRSHGQALLPHRDTSPWTCSNLYTWNPLYSIHLRASGWLVFYWKAFFFLKVMHMDKVTLGKLLLASLQFAHKWYWVQCLWLNQMEEETVNWSQVQI